MADPEIAELIAETIAELEASCRITLYDVYGSTDGFYIAEFKVQIEENKDYERPAQPADYTRRGD